MAETETEKTPYQQIVDWMRFTYPAAKRLREFEADHRQSDHTIELWAVKGRIFVIQPYDDGGFHLYLRSHRNLMDAIKQEIVQYIES